MDFLTEVEESTNSIRELKAAHAETIQELEKTRKILSMESRISRDYKVGSSSCSSKHSSCVAEFRSPRKHTRLFLLWFSSWSWSSCPRR